MSGRALVTGASAGIGLAIARRLAARGWALVLCARRRDRLEALAADLGSRVPVDVIEADLARPGAASEVARQALENGPVDLLVNNAGSGVFGSFGDHPIEGQLDMVRLNVLALVELSGLLLPAMRSRGSGAILNIASTSGFQPLAYAAVYAATKAFVVSFGEALATELRGSGVNVTTFCPGFTDTEFFAAANRVGAAFRPAGFMTMSADEVAEHAVIAMDRRRPLAFAGLRNWLSTWMVSVAPRSLVRRLAAGVFRWLLARQQR